MSLTVLVANRGEVARRVFRTARRMGLRTIAVYSDADAREPFVGEADAAVRIGAAPARDSYLSIERIVAAARETGARFVHPGYGFLAEDARLADAVRAAGLVFVGPPAPVLRLLGSKAESKRSARRANVPVLPGYDGDDQSDEALGAAARGIGFPLLVKPSAGGGGKGIVVVRREAELGEGIASARRIAASAFGDERLILEREVRPARHVEVQFLADAKGGVSILGERDCSSQRRHQKVVEEAPAPHLRDATRRELFAATERLVREVGYVNAGTAEYVVDDREGFFFLEVNARLQVEHPVTEAVLDIDLVELQLRIAADEPLPRQTERIRGHAIEVRVYAEDPGADFAPSTGTVLHVRWPDGVRVDAGIAEQSRVTSYYDPMLAKIVAHGDDRDAALDVLSRALVETQLLGVRSNLAFVRRLLAHEPFRQGRMTTDLIDRDLASLTTAPRASEEAVALAAAGVYASARRAASASDPWTARGAWRGVAKGGSAVIVRDDGHERAVEVSGGGPFHAGIHVLARSSGEPHEWTVDGADAACALEAERAWVVIGGDVSIVETGARERAAEALAAGDLTAPLPGVVVAVHVRDGDRVTRGQPLVVVEAMKMELPLRAPADGIVRGVRCAVDDQVDRGQRLVEFEALEAPTA